ncbi:MAG: hypothetical protein KZQ88_07355 [Candidatus Thiodiazotropha sp. (ex Dulcina madagascariensis)]|nr:hypothetical protein [Candidatus Thiodiazotropha sp. (ex Dulcina madagascariensis)]MCU7925874.1 hypothetical protein [Candidatus Thiodiazotropha sp. (ex Dulcina madagascariensis)]
MTQPAANARSLRQPRTQESDAQTAPGRASAPVSADNPSARDQARFGNAAVVRAQTAQADRSADRGAPNRERDREGESDREGREREESPQTGEPRDDRTPGAREAGDGTDREGEQSTAAAEATVEESEEERRIRRYARELNAPPPTPPPERLAAILPPAPQPLIWEPVMALFVPPRMPDFNRLSRAWQTNDPVMEAEVRREATNSLKQRVAGIRRHHDMAAYETNGALQSIASLYGASRMRLQSEFLRSDYETEMVFNQSLLQARGGAEAADRIILRNYMLARRSLSGAATTAKQGIQANKDNSESQISDILAGLRRGFVTPLTEARRLCREQNRTSRRALQAWKRGLNEQYPISGDLENRIENEAKQAVGPGLADDALRQLRTNANSVITRFTNNITAVRSDIEARVAPSLRNYTRTMVSEGNEDVDEAFNRAFGALKRQANQARQAIADNHAQIVDQLAALRSAERERLEMLMQQTLEAVHSEASAAADLVVSTTEQAMPHYAGAARQLTDSMTEAARNNAASLNNMAGSGARQVGETVEHAHELQRNQLETSTTGIESSLNQRELEIRTELMNIASSVSQNLQGAAGSGEADTRSAAAAMTEGLSALSNGVTAAAAQWLRPLSEAFSKFLDETRADLERGKPAFLRRVGTAKSDFLRYARAQGNPNRLFARALLRAATDAMTKARHARTNLGNSLDAGIFDVIDETGVGNALRGLTALQGRWVQANWPYSNSNWPSTIPKGMPRVAYYEVTGSRDYSLDGHLMFALGGSGGSDYNAAKNYLAGNTAEGARFELEASIHWYNDQESRIENIQKSLTNAQLRELRGMDAYQRNTRNRVRGALGGTDLNVFDALEQGDHARAEAYRMLDKLNNARDRHEIDQTNDILSQYSTGTEWGGERVSAADRRARVSIALAEIRGTSREELETQAAEQNRQREAEAREQAEARERRRQETPVSPTEATSEEALQMCIEPPAPNSSESLDIEPHQLQSRLPDAEATSTPVEATSSEDREGEERQPQPSLAERWMQGTAPPPASITVADVAANMLYQYATRDIEQVRSAGRGETYTVTLRMSDRQRDLARALIFHGEGTPEARAARLGVEVERSGKPNIVNVDRALVDPRLNPDSLAAIDDPVARQRVIDNARQDRERMLAIFARDYGGMEGGTSAEHINVLVGQLETAFGSDTAGAELAGLMVRDQYPSTATAAKAVEYAIEGAGTNNELYFRVTERMNRDQFQEMRRKYNHNTASELYDDLGLFGHGWFGDFSGDDRLRAERGTLGQPRNDRERAEVAAYAIQQQRDEAGWLGGLLASGSMQEVMLDVEEADLNAMIGGPIEFGPEALPIWTTTANFDRDNNFVGDQAMFRATATSAQTAARNYSAKIDQYANFAATAIAVVGAVVAAVVTVLTGGAASPLLLASIAAITGLTAMGAQAAIKGGRYGWEQAVTDLGMTAVQALTAGVGQGLALASRGGMAGLQAGMKAGLSMNAARELARGGLLGNMGRLSGSAFIDKVLIGVGTGALGSTGSAALDERTWAQGGAKGIENLFAASMRGMLSGGVTAGVSNAIEDMPLGRLSRLVGDKTIGEAVGSSTNMLGRGLGKGLSSSVGAFAGRASELGFESARGTYQGDAGDIFLESAKAGGMSLLQSIGEGGAEARAQALFNARYGGRPPIETERAVIHESEEARVRAQQHDAEAEAAAPRSARQPSADEAAHARAAPDEMPSSRTRDSELAEEGGVVPRRSAEAETERRAPIDAEVESRRGDEAEAVRRDRCDETGLDKEQPQRPFVDEAPVLDLEQTRKALAELAEAPAEQAPTATAKAGAAAAIEESAQMRLLPESIDATPAMLRDAADGAIGRVASLAHAEISTGGNAELRVSMTRADGGEVTVRVEFGETQGGDIASFRAADPGDEVQFVVTLSNRAPEDVHARAIGHELAEIRLHGIEGAAAESDLLTTTVRPGEDAKLSAHDVGRLAELEVLSAELAATRAATDDPLAPTVLRLEGEIDSLTRHLGLSHGAEDDRRLTSALAALPGESEAASALASARERAGVLAPARAVDPETTRLTAADQERLAQLDAKAEALERAKESGDMPARNKAQRELEDLIDTLGLSDNDEATGMRAALALETMAQDSPGARALRTVRQRQLETGLNDALRPGHTPDSASVLSDRDRSRVAELTGALRQLHDAQASSAAPTEIARLRHLAQAKAAEMGLVFGDDAAMARTRFLESSLSPKDADLIPRLHEVRESAQSSPLLQPRQGTLEDLPLIASQIAEARAMGDLAQVARLTELAGFRLEHAGWFHADEAVQESVRQAVDRIVDNNPDTRALADDALARHGQRLAAEAIDNELDSVRVSIEEVRQQIVEAKRNTTPVAEGVERRQSTKQYLEDLEALIQRQAKLESDSATARRVAFRPPDTSEAAARAMPPDADTIRNAPLLRSDPDFAGNGERVRRVRQRYGDSPMFQSWERFKQMYMEQNPSIRVRSVRSNTQRDSDFAIDALELERLFSYWSQGRYVDAGAPLSRSLPDLSFISAGKGNPVEFNDPETGARIRLSPSDEATLKSGETLTPSAAAKRRRDLMRERDILQAHHDLETDSAKREQLSAGIKQRAQQIIDISEAMGEAAGLRFAATLPGGREAAEVGRGPGVTDVVHIDPDTGRVSVIECKGGTSQLGSRIAEVDGRRVRAEQTTPEYLRSLAEDMRKPGQSEQSQRLGDAIIHALENDPPGIDSFVVRQPFDNHGNPEPIDVTHYPVKSGS